MKSQTFPEDKKLLRLGVLAPLLLASLWLRTPLSRLLAMLQDRQAVAVFVQGFGAFGLLVLFCLLLAQVFAAVIPGHSLMMAGGYVYGPFLAIATTAMSTILGSQLAFLLARRYGRPVVHRLAKPTAIQRWDRLAEHQGPWFYFFTFVLPIFPSDLMCYVAGLGKVSPCGFFIANLAGRTLCAVSITLIGAFGFRPPWQFWMVLFGGMALFFIAWGIHRWKLTKANTRRDFAYACGLWIMKAYRRIFSIKTCLPNLDHLPPGAKILAANHPHCSDIFLLPLLFRDRLTVIGQANLFKVPLIGWILTHSGHIPVPPDRKHEAFEHACEALGRNETVLIFPEGKLNPDNLEIKTGTGAVRMSLATGAPIIPFGIYVPPRDTFELRFSSRGTPHVGRWQFRGKFILRIGEPWFPGRESPDGKRRTEVHELTRQLMEQIKHLRELAAQEGEP